MTMGARKRWPCVRRCALPADAELQELEATLAPEWESARDDAAYADL
jgi:hypothetical protein